MQMLVSLTTYVVAVLICYGVAYLLNTEITSVVAFAALAMAVDSLTRVD
jgi:small-conductance mechanosensitive channel